MKIYLFLDNTVITGYSLGAIEGTVEVEVENPNTIKLGIDTYENNSIIAQIAPVNNTIRIMELKANLAATDYLCMKHADKVLSDEEYEPIRLQRQAWRDEINTLEA